MYKVAVMGDRDSVLGFRALGLSVFACEDSEAAALLKRLAGEDYAVIYITEHLAQTLAEEIDEYKDAVTPAIVLIPGREGSMGLGLAALKRAVERAVGADIMNT